MERADPTQVQELRKLIDSDTIQDHNQIQALANELFKSQPQDQDYRLCYIIACLKNNHLSQLSNVFKVPPTNKESEDYQITYGYYLYLKEEYQKAIQYLTTLNQTYRIRLLLSQSYFKSLDYKSSSTLYTDLVRQNIKNKNKGEGDNESLIVNLLASLSGTNINQSKLLDELGISKREQKEFLFNLAQVYHNTDKRLSSEYIKRFQSELKLPEDKEDKIASLLLSDFLKYGNQMQVEGEKVKEYNNLNEVEYKEINLDIVLSNNLSVFKQRIGENSNELLKEIEQLLGSKSKQTRQQILRLKINKLILLLRKNRLNDAQKLVKDIDSNFNEQETQLDAYIKAKLYLHIKNHDQKEISNLIGRVSSNKLLEFLLRIQHLRESKQLDQIFNEYKKSSKEILNNEIISKYTIALALKDEKIFESQLEELNVMAFKSNDVRLMKLLIEMYKNKGDTAKIVEVLERILKASPKDQEARLTMAQIRLNEGNVQAAQDLLRNFQKPQEIIDMNHLQALENNIHFSIAKTQVSNKIEAISKLKKRIKKKRVRYPKSYDPEKPGPLPNPQRWLPKYQRKDFKKKKNFKSGRTQGATVGKESVNTYTGGNTTSNLNVNTGKGKRRKN